MAKTKSKKSSRSLSNLEVDSGFIFKIVLFLLLGSQWLYIVEGEFRTLIPIPLGAIIGIVFVLKDRHRVDRQIEYVLLLVAMFIGFWLPMGITIRL